MTVWPDAVVKLPVSLNGPHTDDPDASSFCRLTLRQSAGLLGLAERTVAGQNSEVGNRVKVGHDRRCPGHGLFNVRSVQEKTVLPIRARR
jgi:hypothetical protein